MVHKGLRVQSRTGCTYPICTRHRWFTDTQPNCARSIFLLARSQCLRLLLTVRNFILAHSLWSTKLTPTPSFDRTLIPHLILNLHTNPTVPRAIKPSRSKWWPWIWLEFILRLANQWFLITFRFGASSIDPSYRILWWTIIDSSYGLFSIKPLRSKRWLWICLEFCLSRGKILLVMLVQFGLCNGSC